MAAEVMAVTESSRSTPPPVGAAASDPAVVPDALEQALRDAREQSSASREILHALGRERDGSGRILDTIIERAVRLCRADAAQLYLLDGAVLRLSRLSGAVPEEFRQYLLGHPVERSRDTLVGRVALDMRTQKLDDVLADPQYGRPDLQRLGDFRTLLSAPMLLGDEVVGVLSMWRTQVLPFSDRDMALLEEFAAQAAIALQHVELMTALHARGAELASKVHQLEVLREVGDTVSSSLDPDAVLDSIVTNAVQLTDADGGSIMEYDADVDGFVVRAAHGSSWELLDRLRGATIRRDATLVGRAATERRPLQVEDLGAAALDPHLEVLHRDGWRSVLAIPMLRGPSIVGVVVIRRRRPGAFPEEMVELLETFATQSSVALVNARLFKELETKSAELQVASRHKSEFLASMSHELRTPLNAVIGFSEVLLDRMFGELNERQDEYVRDIWRSGRHLLELLNEILDLSKVEAGRMVLEPSTISVGRAIEYAVSLVRERAAREGITVTMEVDAGADTLRADELRFRQVLLNLLSNAVKFTDTGGSVAVRAAREGPELVVTVSDTGVGIPPEDRERIFESFQQGGRGLAREEGTGLGLTLTRRIVDLFGGRLWVESEVGVGSVFGFAVPLAGRGADAPADRAARSGERPR
ncbi:sensor histidine kinase [Ornithinimicrobium cerasi]|uniref:histidine kinase n=1 Tax=Ornithinimicrobium cerasi TaxID=2248773 RepID=A0A285VS90_9MICO|nr:GAF domain-containing protein [Ornithinimicrobium cerasi]SOC55481.1 GAF domain-containing protein [Ornithinimicrobium cerasi]